MHATFLDDPDHAGGTRTPFRPSIGSKRTSGGGKKENVGVKVWDARCRLHGRHFILARDAQTAHAIAKANGLRADTLYPLPVHISPVFGDQTCIKA